MPLTHFTFQQENFGKNQVVPLSELFSLMNSKKHTRFIAYLESPYHNKDEKLIRLYEYIKNASERKTGTMNAIVLLRKWNTKKRDVYTIKDIKKALKDLLNHLFNFLAIEELKNEKTKLQTLQKAFRNKGVKHTYQIVCEKLKQGLAKEPKGIEHLFDDFQLSHLSYFEQDMDHERKGLTAFNLVDYKLDVFTKTLKAAYACEKMNLKNSASEKKNARVSTVFSPTKGELDLEGIYKLNAAILDDKNYFSKNKFQEFSDAFLQSKDQLDAEERYILCKHTVNQIIRAKNNGMPDMKDDLYVWYKRKINHSLPFLNVGGLKKNDYLNPINMFLSNGDKELANNYINTFTKFLEHKKNDPAYFLGQVYCHHHNNDVDTALSVLNERFPLNYQHKFFCIAIRVKSMRLKLYLEQILKKNNDLLYLDLFEKEIEAFGKYLHRKHEKIIIPRSYVLRYSNFIKIIQLITLSTDKVIKNGKRKDHGRALLQTLYETKPINSSKWFETKIKTLFAL